MATFYISPTGSGSGDGSSWANAATLSKLPSLTAKAGAGGEVLIRADQGVYNVSSPIILKNGGVDGAPVTIRGVDGAGNSLAAEFVGTRNISLGANGAEVFRLMNGANDLTFEHLIFRNIGNGAFRIGADVNDLTIQHVDAFNVQRFVENLVSGTNTTATISGLTVRDVEVHGYSKGVVRLQYNTHNVVIEDVLGDSERQTHDDFAMGVMLDGTVHDVVVRNTTMANNWNTSGTYWNGDGFVTEKGVYRVLFQNTRAFGNSDGGYDLKSSDTVLDGAFAEANKRNFRFWGKDEFVVMNSTGLNPYKAGGSGDQSQVWLNDGARVTILNSHFADSRTNTIVFDLGDNSRLDIYDTTVLSASGARVQRLAPGSDLNLNEASATTYVMTTPLPVVSGATAATPLAVTAGSDGDDVLSGSNLDDRYQAGSGADVVYGYGGFDVINGNPGNDTIAGGDGGDWLLGGRDNDRVDGEAGNDLVNGNLGDDTCLGADGADSVRGGQGADSLSGGAGDDWLTGDRGDDVVAGGEGADVFYVFTGSGRDVVIDFSVGQGDRIQLAAGETYAVAQQGADVVVTLGGGDSIVLQGVQASTLSSGWIFS